MEINPWIVQQKKPLKSPVLSNKAYARFSDKLKTEALRAAKNSKAF